MSEHLIRDLPTSEEPSHRTFAQKAADAVTEFSGSWPFIIAFTIVCTLWIAWNVCSEAKFDPYPFLFLNWLLTVVSTFQNPLIMLSQNRQNEVDRDRMIEIHNSLEEIKVLLKAKTPR